MDNELAMYAGGVIRRLRREAGLNQTQLAKSVGITTAAISKYENGERAPKQDMLFKLADVLNVSVNEFFPESGSDSDNKILNFDKGAGIEIHESMEGSLERQESYLISLLQVQNGILTELKQIRKYLEDKNNG